MSGSVLPAKAPKGFAFDKRGSGLLVPDRISTRDRKVWTRAEGRTIERALELLKRSGDDFQIHCPHEQCKASHGKVEIGREADGTIVWRCNHLDRIFSRAF
jgi:hypothetical protein